MFTVTDVVKVTHPPSLLDNLRLHNSKVDVAVVARNFTQLQIA